MQMPLVMIFILRSQTLSCASALVRAALPIAADSSAVYVFDEDTFGIPAPGSFASLAETEWDAINKASTAVAVMIRIGHSRRSISQLQPCIWGLGAVPQQELLRFVKCLNSSWSSVVACHDVGDRQVPRRTAADDLPKSATILRTTGFGSRFEDRYLCVLQLLWFSSLSAC